MVARPIRSGVPPGGRPALVGIVAVGTLVACSGDAGDADLVLAVGVAFSLLGGVV
jgi:hypothetical protein